MPDELIQQVPETPQEPAPVATPEPPPTPSWSDLTNTIDPKDIRRQPRVAGIIGSELQRARMTWKQESDDESARAAAHAHEQSMIEMAKSDPDAFAEKYLSDFSQTYAQRQTDGIRGQTRKELASSIGKAYNDLPEWQELTDADHQALAQALMGITDDEVLPTFARHAIDLLAEHRAKKKLESWKQKELPKERDALRKEEAAKLLKSSEGPDLTPPKSQPGKIDVQAMTDEEFDKYWNSRK